MLEKAVRCDNETKDKGISFSFVWVPENKQNEILFATHQKVVNASWNKTYFSTTYFEAHQLIDDWWESKPIWFQILVDAGTRLQHN